MGTNGQSQLQIEQLRVAAHFVLVTESDVIEAFDRQFDLRGQSITLYKSLPEGTQVPFDIQEFVDSSETIDENLNKFFEVAGCATVNPRFMADAEYNEILSWYRNVEKIAMSNIKFLEKWDEKVKTFQSILIALLGRGQFPKDFGVLYSHHTCSGLIPSLPAYSLLNLIQAC